MDAHNQQVFGMRNQKIVLIVSCYFVLGIGKGGQIRQGFPSMRMNGVVKGDA